MAWISVHENVDGPKLRNLYKELKCSKFEAVGILNFLWFWGLVNSEKDGHILFADKEDIAVHFSGLVAGSQLVPVDIVEALCKTGWIDQVGSELYIHDWETWQEQWYKAQERREADAQRKRTDRARKREASTNAVPIPTEGSPDSCQPGGEVGGQELSPPEPPAPPGPPTPPEDPTYTPDFEQFWTAYPRKIEKGNAYKKYNARRKDGYSPTELLGAAKAYAAEVKRKGTEKDYIKHPKTFLSDSLPFLDYIPKREEVPEPQSAEPVQGNLFENYREEDFFK